MNDTKLRREDQIEQREAARYNPTTSKDLLNGEQAGSSIDPYAQAGIDQAEVMQSLVDSEVEYHYRLGRYQPMIASYLRDKAQGGTATSDSIDSVRDGEGTSGWNNRWSGGKKSQKQGSGFGKVMKRFGPSGAIGGGLIGIVITLASGTSMSSLLLNHISAGFLNKWDTRTTTSTVRTNMILKNKLVGETTSGSCSIVKVACRYSKPSNKLLKNLGKQGVTAFANDGSIIEPKLIGFNDRPARYELTRSNGTKLSVPSGEFAKTLDNDVEFRKAFHAAYNTKFQNFVDSVFARVLGRFAASKADKLGKSKTTQEAQDTINSETQGPENGAKAAAAEGDSAITKLMKKLFGEEIDGMLKKLAKVGKTSVVSDVAGVVCMAADAPGIITKVVRAYQMAQLVKFALVFLTTADKIRAQSATTEEVAALGDALTTVTVSVATGEIINRAATDSFGVKYGLFGDTATGQQTAGHEFNKFSPGGNIIKALGNITKYSDSKTKKDACNVATNPLTGAAINIALAANAPDTLGLSLVGAAVNIVAGMAISAVIEAVSGPLAETMAGLLSPLFPLIIPFFLGDLTKDLVGEDVGNAFASGSAGMLSQNANAGGNLPLSIVDALAYDKVTQKVNLAYAEEDRVGRSPFDISSPNTFMGSIVSRFIPYYSSIGSIPSMLSAVSSISLGSYGALLGSPARAAAGQEYTMCDDPSLNDGKMAVGPFCNIAYGIPEKYLGTDPQAVMQSLVDSDQVDSDTGNPKPGSELEFWMTTCLDGKTDEANNCRLDADSVPAADKQKFANFALYTVDHQVQKTMDGEDTADSTSASGGSSVSLVDPSQWAVSKDSPGIINKESAEWTQWATAIGGNGNSSTGVLVPIAIDGSNICPQSNTLNQNGGGNLFNPNAAASAAALIKSYDSTHSGKYLVPGACFRSISAQQAAWDNYQAGGNLAAEVGTSNHGWGLAIDFRVSDSADGVGSGISGFDTPDYLWMTDNAYKFGWVNPLAMQPAGGCTGNKCEPWHFQYVGPLYGT